ncbi:MAG: ABC transporter permease [bacterium]
MFVDYILSSLKSLKQYKLRSFLTILGVTIGVFSIVAIITIGEEGKRLIIREITGSGTNLVVAHNDQMMETRVDKFAYLTETQLETMKRDIPGIADLAPQYFLSTPMKVRGENKLITVIGVPANWFEVRGLDLIIKGRKFTDNEVKSSEKVCVIGHQLFNSLFGKQKKLGQEINIEGTYFKVIGLMGFKLKMGPMDPNNALLLPSSCVKRLLGAQEIYLVFFKARNGVSVSGLKERVENYLFKTFSNRKVWEVVTMDEMIEMLSTITNIISIVISSIAAISLLVGGIGIMNIMLVAVRERTREIGIRKAVGATKKDILWQFLIESLILCLTGGIIGIGAAIGVILLIAKMMNLDIFLSFWAIMLGFSFSCLVGIFFGVYPAHLAAKLNPVEALRYE